MRGQALYYYMWKLESVTEMSPTCFCFVQFDLSRHAVAEAARLGTAMTLFADIYQVPGTTCRMVDAVRNRRVRL